MENNENKNNKGLIILIVIFSLIVLGLGGWIIYDNVTRGKEEPKQEENNNQEKQNEEVIDETDNQLAKIKKEYPKSNDSTVTGDNVYDYLSDGGYAVKLTFYYNNYKIIYNYIDGSGDESEIRIYDKDDKQVYFNENIKTYIIDDEYEYISYLPTIAGGKLHVLSYNPKKCYIYDFEEERPYLEYKQIDLGSDIISEKTIVSLKYPMLEGSSYCE